MAEDVGEPAVDVDVVAAELEAALAGRTWHRKEIDALLPQKSATAWSGVWIPLVRVPPSSQSMATFLVDGSVAGSWRVERTAARATLRLRPFERLPHRARDELREEGERLVRCHEPNATSYAVARPRSRDPRPARRGAALRPR